MTHKHTPAPWTVTKHFYVIDVHGVLADDELIAGDIGSLADANLIAAAPDMLEALHVILDAADDRVNDGLGHDLPPIVREKIERWIRKAKGGDT